MPVLGLARWRGGAEGVRNGVSAGLRPLFERGYFEHGFRQEHFQPAVFFFERSFRCNRRWCTSSNSSLRRVAFRFLIALVVVAHGACIAFVVRVELEVLRVRRPA